MISDWIQRSYCLIAIYFLSCSCSFIRSKTRIVRLSIKSISWAKILGLLVVLTVISEAIAQPALSANPVIIAPASTPTELTSASILVSLSASLHPAPPSESVSPASPLVTTKEESNHSSASQPLEPQPHTTQNGGSHSSVSQDHLDQDHLDADIDTPNPKANNSASPKEGTDSTAPLKTYFLNLISDHPRQQVTFEPPAFKIKVSVGGGANSVRCGNGKQTYTCASGKPLVIERSAENPMTQFWAQNSGGNQARLRITVYQ